MVKNYKIELCLFAVIMVLFLVCPPLFSLEVDPILPLTKEEQFGKPSNESIHYYIMGEMAYSEGNYMLAFTMFKQAESYDDKSIHIKVSLLDALYRMASENELYYYEMAKLGDQYIEEGYYSADLFEYIGIAYQLTNRAEEGFDLFKIVIDENPDAYRYLNYFRERVLATGNPDLDALEKAYELSEYNIKNLLSIARLYIAIDPYRSEVIYKEALNRFDNEEAYKELSIFYRAAQDKETLFELIRNRLDEEKYVSLEDKSFFIDESFHSKRYEEISYYAKHFRDVTNLEILLEVYIALYWANNYEVAYEFGEYILDKFTFSMIEEYIKLIVFPAVAAYAGEYKLAAEYFMEIINSPDLKTAVNIDFEHGLKTNDLSNPYHFLSSLAMDLEDKESLDPEQLFAELLMLGYDPLRIDCLRAEVDAHAQRGEQAKDRIEKLALLEIDDEEILFSLGNLSVYYGLYDIAYDMFSKIATFKEESPHSIIVGSMIKFGFISLAEEYLLTVFEDIKNPPPTLFILLASIYKNSGRAEEGLALIENGLELYPEDSHMLNWLGYILLTETERLPEAEQHLFKAISLAPDDLAIQDSVAWLYYNKGDYLKALEYLKSNIEQDSEDSIIFYHIGAVYFRLSDYHEARYYLNKAIVTNNDEDSVVEAILLLQEIDKIEK
ncbi:MAG: tetratricopeptide repeat protein [Candidatus Cloacimonadia bacterium]